MSITLIQNNINYYNNYVGVEMNDKIVKVDSQPNSNQFRASLDKSNHYYNNCARVEMNGKVVKVDKESRVIYKPNSNELYSGYASLKSNRLFSYEGEVKNGKFHGVGNIFDYQKDEGYKGSFHEGKCHGWGMQYNSNNECVYKGPMRDNKRHGENGAYYENGFCFYGGFKKDNYHGRVKTYLITNPSVPVILDSEFKKGKRHGKCVGYDIKGNLCFEYAYNNGKRSAEVDLDQIDENLPKKKRKLDSIALNVMTSVRVAKTLAIQEKYRDSNLLCWQKT